MSRVVTYQLAYLSHRYVSLCQACADRDDHGLGSLGPVSHGAHWGCCDSPWHGTQPAAQDEVRS